MFCRRIKQSTDGREGARGAQALSIAKSLYFNPATLRLTGSGVHAVGGSSHGPD